jgi:hypothetical protein
LLAVAWAYHAWTGRDGMGGGDIKLLRMIGAFLSCRIGIARDELRAFRSDGEQRPESVPLQLAEPVRMVERLAASPER